MKFTKTQLTSLVEEEVKKVLKETIDRDIDPDELSDEDVLDAEGEPTSFDLHDPESRLLAKLAASEVVRKKYAGKKAEEIASDLGLGSDPQIIDLINQMIIPGKSVVSPPLR